MQVSASGQLHVNEAAAHQSASAEPVELLSIGLVNLMPMAAARRGAAEYCSLLQAHSHRPKVRLQCFSDVPQFTRRSASITRHPLEALWEARLDGLIVTGAEPKASSIADEPLLPLLRQLVEWGARNTKSVIFSCFAAHAAVWCLDGIARVPLAEKLSGVFACRKSVDHPITAAMPDSWIVPHSRHNTLDANALRAAGYLVLSEAPRLGADMFLKQHGGSELLFVQGHLEYGPEVLLSEYCRDLKRFADGLSPRPPSWPEHYLTDVIGLGPSLADNLDADAVLQDKRRGLKLIAEGGFDHPWNDTAGRLMDGWLGFLARHNTEFPGLVCQ